MTSSPDTVAASSPIEPLPPALASMWRLCRLGLRHEPRLMVLSFVLSLFSALPDAFLAVWLKLLGDGLLGQRPTLVRTAGDRPGALGNGDLVSPSPEHASRASIPRSGHDRPRITRRQSSSIDCQYRAP